MRVSKLLTLAVLPVAVLFVSGCGAIPKTFKESSLDDMHPILSGEEYDALESLQSDDEINQFLDAFWNEKESIAGSLDNEIKNEYLQRLEYANSHFPDRRGWGRSERKKVYLMHGPPRSIDRYELTGIPLGRFSTIKSVEIWYYFVPGLNSSFSSYGDDIQKGEKRFIFGDITGSGFYELLYSSEDCADIDTRMFIQNGPTRQLDQWIKLTK